MIQASSGILESLWQPLLAKHIIDSFNFCGVAVDSRKVKRNKLYFALQGRFHHGIEFIKQAKENGAIAIVTDQITPKTIGIIQIIVTDTQDALVTLACWWRKQCHQTCVVGITGSHGKTTVCQIVGQLLGHFDEITYTQLNQNNELGVALNLLNMKQTDRWAVLELGARKRRDIQKLATYCLPDVGVITAIGSSHLGEFGDIETIFMTKTELLQALPERGCAVLPQADQYQKRWQTLTRRLQSTHWFGYKKKDLQKQWQMISPINWDDATQTLLYRTQSGQSYTINIPFLGLHMSPIFECVFSTMKALGFSIEQYLPFVPTLSRVARRFEPTRVGNCMIIDDSYNASPVTMKLALDSFDQMEADKKIVVLGEMAELGSSARHLHQEVFHHLSTKGVDYYFLIGNAFEKMSKPDQGEYCKTTQGLVERILEKLALFHDQRVLLLFKASNHLHFDQLIDSLSQKMSS